MKHLDLKQNITRWVSTLQSVLLALVISAMEEPNKKSFEDIAGRLEEIAANIRARTKDL